MHKIIFGYWGDKQVHPGYDYLKSEARKEGWSGTPGLKEMVTERWGKNARLYFRDGDVHGIGFKNSDAYNAFLLASGASNQLEMF